MATPAVKEKGWYKQWRHTVAENLEKVSRWGAEAAQLATWHTQLEACNGMLAAECGVRADLEVTLGAQQQERQHKSNPLSLANAFSFDILTLQTNHLMMLKKCT